LLVVATAAADIGKSEVLPAARFRMRSIERDAFTQATGYSPGIRIDGIELCDRVWLDCPLTSASEGHPATDDSGAVRDS
jgi:hypothetical protein